MGKEKKSRAEMAQDRILTETCMEYVTDVYVTPDFVQICGMAGGDALCFRVYENGMIVEK